MGTRISDRQRLAGLDVLRAIAVLLVIPVHALTFFDTWPAAAVAIMKPLMLGGGIGVDLFFVLSGFLVSGLLFREQQRFHKVSVLRFLARRGFKIYPLFYFYLAFIAIHTVIAGGKLEGNVFLSEALFVQNYGPRFFIHTWSLAIEEHFYVLCALFLLFLSRRSPGSHNPFASIPKVTAAIGVACLAGRLAVGLRSPFAAETHLFPTHLRLDGLMYGVCLAYYYHYRRELLERVVAGRELLLVAVGIALFVPSFVLPPHEYLFVPTLGITLYSFGSALFIVVIVLRGVPTWRLVRALAFIGRASYAIYLWHLIVDFELARPIVADALGLTIGSFACVLVYIGASVVVGIAASMIIERPMLYLRDRIFPSRSGPAVLPLPAPVTKGAALLPAP